MILSQCNIFSIKKTINESVKWIQLSAAQCEYTKLNDVLKIIYTYYMYAPEKFIYLHDFGIKY